MIAKRFALVLLLLPIILTGCWDSQEIEDQYLVWGMGWDISESSPHLLTLTLSAPTITPGAPEPVKVISSEGHSVENARMNAQTQMEKTIQLGHMRLLVVGEELAAKGIQPLLDPLGRNPRIGRETLIVVMEGRALDLWDLEPASNPVPTDYVARLIHANDALTRSARVTFRDFFELLSQEGREPYTPYLRLSKDKATVNAYSIAVFKRDKMVGIFEDMEAQIFRMIKGDIRSGMITIGNVMDESDFNYATTYIYRRGSRSIRTEVRDGEPHAYLKIELEGDIQEHTSLAPMDIDHNIKSAEKDLSERIKREVEKIIEIAQKEFDSDVFGFGAFFRAYQSKYWNSVKWDEEFSKLKVHTDVEVSIRRIGIEN